MRPLHFEVYGQPRPSGSKRAVLPRGGTRPYVIDDNKHSREWKNLVSDAVRAAYSGPLLTGPVSLRIRFVFLRPKAHFGKRRGEPYLKDTAPSWMIVKPDLTKIVRATEDALKGILWHDDSQVAQQYVEKIYGTWQGCLIEVVPLREDVELEQLRYPDSQQHYAALPVVPRDRAG